MSCHGWVRGIYPDNVNDQLCLQWTLSRYRYLKLKEAVYLSLSHPCDTLTHFHFQTFKRHWQINVFLTERPGGVRGCAGLRQGEDVIMLLLQNGTDRLETSWTAQRGEQGANTGPYPVNQAAWGWWGKGKVSPRPHFHFLAADRVTWVRRGDFFSPHLSPLTPQNH